MTGYFFAVGGPDEGSHWTPGLVELFGGGGGGGAAGGCVGLRERGRSVYE